MKKALMVWGGWDGHEPKQCADVFAPILQSKGFEVEVCDTLDVYLDRDLMQSLSLIVPVWTMGSITREQERGLLDAVRSGVGIAGWHGGMGDSFRQNTEYQWMVGGQWVAHPDGVSDYRSTSSNTPTRSRMASRTSRCTPSSTTCTSTRRTRCWRRRPSTHASAPWVWGCVMPVVWKRM